MNKTSLTRNEYEQLTIKQKAKYRRELKKYEERLNPIRSACIKREHEVRQQAYKDLNITERVEEAERPIREAIKAIEEQQKELNLKWRELSDQLYKAGTDIQTEPYKVAHNDPEVKVLSKMWGDMNEQWSADLSELIKTFTDELLEGAK